MGQQQAVDDRQLAECSLTHREIKCDLATFLAATKPGFLFDGTEYRTCRKCGSSLAAPKTEATK